MSPHVEIAGPDGPLVLRADRTLWLPGSRCLVVSDVHLGKAAVFRRHGLPIPEGDTAADLARLSAALEETGAQRLLIAGDWFHAPAAHVPVVLEAVQAWRARHAGLPVRLVAGNHDRGAAMPPASLDFAVSPRSHREGALTIVHDPADAEPDEWIVAGHLHPVLRLRGRGPGVPCFWLRATGLVLPGFGTFTGGAAVSPAPEDRLFAVADATVLEVPRALVRG